MTTDPLRLALVGLRGINAWHYFPGLAHCPQVQLVGGVDPSPEARAAFAAKSPVPLFASLAELVERCRPEAVLIGTPNHLHLANVREALAAGLHVSVTKPLANTVADCQEAIRLARAAGRLLQVGHEYRFRPSIARALALAQAPETGPVQLAVAHMGHDGGLSKLTAAGTWRNDPANVPGGCVNMLGVHLFDTCNALFGQPLAVSATLRHRLSQVPMTDTASVTLEYAHGALAVLTTSYVSAPADHFQIFGRHANYFATDTRLFREVAREWQPVADLPSASSAVGVLAEFVAALRHGAPLATPGKAGLLAVAELEAAIRSDAAGGRPVPLAEVLGNPTPAAA